ncbi:MAG: amidohydrolase [Deltaproteobacteria bacterium]|jgi:5-methylthioadenosine/S-adenosylhomocysteine deaminase|nr:amidohydrolase [Deltaproteobacteria bacterium]
MLHDILIKNCSILLLSHSGTELIEKGFVSIREGVISGLGPMADFPGTSSAGRIIDASGRLAMPGLVNTHTHAPMSLFRGMADDLELMTWLNEHIFPAEAKSVNEEMVYWCAKLAAAEMILSGTTTVADGYFLEDIVGDAFVDCGIRAVIAQGVIDFPAPGVPDPALNVEAAEHFIGRWQDRNALITPAIFCHSPYTCSPETLKQAKEAARQKNVMLFVHLAETKTEVAQIRDHHSTTPVRYLESLGILDEATVCVHCIWLDDEEIDILAGSGAKVASCPQSNMKLGSGIAPLKKMIAAGISVGLGTDGCASNNSLDLFFEMDICAKLHKVKDLDPTALPARTVLEMATTGGAAALGLADEIGTLAVGRKADIILLDLMQPHLQPFYHPDLLVYAAGGGDVSDVIIDGKCIVQDRQILTFDIDETMAKVRELAEL